MEPAAAGSDQLGDLVAQDEILGVGAAQQDYDVGFARELLEQRADRVMPTPAPTSGSEGKRPTEPS